MAGYWHQARQRIKQRQARQLFTPRRVHNNERKPKPPRAQRARALVEKLKDGGVLCRHHQHNRVVWCLVSKGGSEFLTHEAVTDALAS